ncbi:MAG: DUF3696 domain-containing protein [Chloroflexi bacterium]|nr:DUF3696 domain-containing protein [Chloroflexota bacterium]
MRLAPLTLLFGANSSGKSSIGQFLMMLKQTAESSDRKTVLNPGGRNSAVHLGSYQEMVSHHDLKQNITAEYQWTFQNPLRFKDPISQNTYDGDTLDFTVQVGLATGDQQQLVLRYFEYGLRDGDQLVLSIGMKRQGETKSEYRIESTLYSLRRKQGRAWNLSAPVRFYGFPDEVVAYHQNADFVQDINLRHEQLFGRLFYLGPLRTRADRLYSWTGIEPESVGYEGEQTVAAILAARSRRISPGLYKHARPFEETLALKLKEMGLIDDFKINRISEQRQEYEVKLRTRGSRDWVDLPDVGFGVSQVLPVLVQCYYAPANSIIIMEQPEIHLHPGAQSALADVMIEAINSRENGVDRNIQLIIETHSEHFLRRIQRRIAEEVVPQEKVSVYFANVNRSTATLEPLAIDAFGSIRNWPENFFGDELGDITEQAKAAMKRRVAQSNSAKDGSI